MKVSETRAFLLKPGLGGPVEISGRITGRSHRFEPWLLFRSSLFSAQVSPNRILTHPGSTPATISIWQQG